jgi:hypothetical protein
MSHPSVTGGRDDTTRYLCAAAHLDATFADRAIREFLVEPTRAVPPAPGVNAPAVLAEAVAARARRKLRDGALVVLALVVLVFASWPVLGLWAVVGLAVGLPSLIADATDTVKKLAPLLGGVVVVVVGIYLFTGAGSASPTGYLDSTGAAPDDTDSVVATVLSTVAVLGILVVFLIDEFVVAKHINTRFRRGRRIGDVVVRPEQRQVLTFAPRRSLAELNRHLRGPMEQPMAPAAAPARNGDQQSPATVVVSRGFNPFTGAGLRYRPWSLAVPLEPMPDREAVPLTAAVLYQRIGSAVNALCGAPNLSPGGRFTELRIAEQIVVSAEELIDHDGAAARDFLANHGTAPYPLLRAERARQLRDHPLEWARYYLHFQLETWDRDFVVSTYLHVAVNANTLYVEWTPCVLLPIRTQYRQIDARPVSNWPAVGQALVQLITLPATLPIRFAGVFSRIRPLPRQRGVVSPDMFGAKNSLRELAADKTMRSYFQLADLERYVKVLQSRFTLAVIDTLREAGYSVAALERHVHSVVDNSVSIGGSVAGNVITGQGNNVGNMTYQGAATK